MCQYSALTSLGDSHHALATASDKKTEGGNGLGTRLVLSRSYLVLSWSHSKTTVTLIFASVSEVVLKLIESDSGF